MSEWFDAEGHADRALEMYERGRWAEAEIELRKALSLHPDHPEWHFNLGLTLEAAGRDADALLSYQRAIDLMPDQADPLVAASLIANRLGQHQQALDWCQQALRIDPAHEAAHANRIESHIRLGHHEEAETAFYLAQHALAEPSAACFAVMAESLFHRSQNERAEWCLREALRLEPHMPRLRARLAAVSTALGKPERALQLYLRELRDDPGNIDTLLDYGHLLAQLGRAPEAAEKFRRVLELEPANIEAHFELGRIAAAALRDEQACIEFELVLKLDPQFPGIRRELAHSLLRRNNLQDARAHLQQEFEAIKIALAEAETHQPADASQATQATVQADPIVPSPGQPDWQDAFDLPRLADLLIAAQEFSKAVQTLELAIQHRESADLLRQLALARYQSGDLAGGSAVSRRILRLDPQCIRSIHNLALAALQQGQIRTAAGWVERGLQIDRTDEGLRRLRLRVWLAQATIGIRWLYQQAAVTWRMAEQYIQSLQRSGSRETKKS